jgi:predicted phage terminase large subunit-like protein
MPSPAPSMEALYRDALRGDLMTFAERCFRELKPAEPFVHASYLELLAAKLDAARRGEIRRLIICLPPRHLKSVLASVALPAFILAKDPSRSVICVSYGQDLADALARDTRRIMQSPWYGDLFPRTRLVRNATSDFATSAGGFRLATSVGGVLTGRGSDFIIIDDPMKPDEALSAARRATANDWFTNTLLSRLNNQETGVVIVVMQRVHLDDLVGNLIAADGWELLSLPAFAEEDEAISATSALGPVTFRRRKGEVLHSARLSRERLSAIRTEIGPYNFAGQYQQNPVPIEGNMVRRSWFKRFPAASPPVCTGIVQSWDTANKAGELNDYSVCTTWGIYDRTYYLLDVFRQRLEFPDLLRAVTSQAEKLSANTILIEDKASGTQLIQELQRQARFNVRPIEPPPGTDKVMRLHLHTATFEAGRVFLPDDAPWVETYINELTGFPGMKHDDQVDSTTQALTFFDQGYDLDVWRRLMS